MEFFLLSQGLYQMFVSIQTSNNSKIDQVVFNWILNASLTSEFVEWTPIQIGATQNNVVTMEARARVFCSRNYYGVKCTEMCYKRNHGNTKINVRCDPDGNEVCLAGYTNVTTNCITRESTVKTEHSFHPQNPPNKSRDVYSMLLNSWRAFDLFGKGGTA